MRIRWTDLAEKDLDAIGAYHEEAAGKTVATKVVLQLIRAADTLLENPARAKQGRAPGTRELVLTDLPYILPFRVIRDEIQILRVFHTSRKPPSSW